MAKVPTIKEPSDGNNESQNNSIMQPPQGSAPRGPKVGIHPISIDDLNKEGKLVPNGNEFRTEY